MPVGTSSARQLRTESGGHDKPSKRQTRATHVRHVLLPQQSADDAQPPPTTARSLAKTKRERRHATRRWRRRRRPPEITTCINSRKSSGAARRGAAEATLPSTWASAAWAHIAAFCELHKYLPGIDVCELAAGEDGQPGCVRYVASLHPPSAGAGDDDEREVASWAREELLEIDHGARLLAYAVVASSMGFGRYVATMTVLAAGEEGCRLVWGFECDPVQWWSLDGLLGYIDGGVKGIAKRIEEAEKAAAVAAGGDRAAGGDVVAAA